MEKVTTPDEAIERVPDGSRVLVPPGLSFGPNYLLEALGRRSYAAGITLICSLNSLPPTVVSNPKIRILTWQLFAGTRPLFDRGRASFLPLRYSEFPKAFGRGRPLQPDVLLAQLPPPGPGGAVSPGVAGSILLDVARSTRLVVAELSVTQPFTFSRPALSLAQIDVAVEVAAPPPVFEVTAASPAERQVARNVAAIIPDRATLQFGIGGAVEAVLAELGDHSGLGVHSGMISDGILPLIEAGVVTNAHKGLLPGKTVTGLLLGSDRLLRWADHNPDLLVVPAGVSHGHRSLARVRRLTAINSAIEVDLSGQINAEFLRGREYSGVGGQGDFAFAASTDDRPGSLSIVALTSTNRDGSISRIVSRLGAGVTVTTPRYCVDVVVTEFGVADLRARTLEERARALLAIAHPAHRERLEREAAGPA